MKKCPKCSLEKPFEEFYKSKKTKDGYRSWCKFCQKKDNSKREPSYNEYRKKYRLENKEESKKKKKNYYKNNKSFILSNNKNWRSTFKGRLNSYKRSSLLRNIFWDLSDEQFKSFYNLNCHYCNDKINGVGIDRINSLEGYTIKNTVPCCYHCNIMKMDYTQEEFLNQIKKIWDNIKK